MDHSIAITPPFSAGPLYLSDVWLLAHQRLHLIFEQTLASVVQVPGHQIGLPSAPAPVLRTAMDHGQAGLPMEVEKFGGKIFSVAPTFVHHGSRLLTYRADMTVAIKAIRIFVSPRQHDVSHA
jgi:hypothetical protein